MKSSSRLICIFSYFEDDTCLYCDIATLNLF